MPVYFVYFLFTSVYKEIFEPILSPYLKSLTGCPNPKSLKKTTKQIKLPTSTKNFIKTLSKALMLRGAGIQPGGGILDTCLRG
jgi:hypothetical protein